jgi:hypothetical protein
MRHWLLILMIVFLPLRGWAAGGMATQMAGQQIASQAMGATETVANYHYVTGTSGHFDHQNGNAMTDEAHADCPGHAAKPAAPGQTVDCGGTCGVCQVCHSVALVALSPRSFVAVPTLSASPFDASRFTSADRALSQKPPIS